METVLQGLHSMFMLRFKSVKKKQKNKILGTLSLSLSLSLSLPGYKVQMHEMHEALKCIFLQFQLQEEQTIS